LRFLLIGDVIGRTGRNTLKEVLPEVKKKYKPDFIVINGENLAGGYGITKKVFKEGEVPRVKEVFKRWLKITLSSEFDDKYWQWQTFVGLVHIKRGVTNNVFISMLSVVTEMLVEEVTANVPNKVGVPILKAWLKLSRILGSLISESYRIFYLKAVEEVTSIDEKLLNRISILAIDNLLKENENFRI